MTGSVCRARLVASVTSDTPVDLGDFLLTLPQGTPAASSAHYESTLPRRLGIQIPAQISYAVLGYQTAQNHRSYGGTLRLMGNIASYDYLWNQIRVQGGAYGTGLQASRLGDVFCYSYRDPSPARSLGVYRSLSQFFTDFQKSPESLISSVRSRIRIRCFLPPMPAAWQMPTGSSMSRQKTFCGNVRNSFPLQRTACPTGSRSLIRWRRRALYASSVMKPLSRPVRMNI